MLRSLAVILVLCAGCGPMEEDEVSATATQAVTANTTVGVHCTPTSSVKLRRGPGTGYAELATIPSGTKVTTTASGAPTDGYYRVKFGTQTGWASGAFLRSPTAVFGYYPDARDAFLQLGVTSSRVSQTIGSAPASAGYHKRDGTVNGVDYCAATDVRVGGLSEAQIKALLENMAKLGFAGWYRKPGFDGWPSSEAPHIHTVHVSAPMKSELAMQVNDWLIGRNGLTSHSTYRFYDWSPAATDQVKRLMGKLAPPVGRDGDGDGKLDFVDNCPTLSNANQLDTDADGQGDACDTDNDGDGVLDTRDNCPTTRNPTQVDQDADGKGDACDLDVDGDGKPDTMDNCPRVANANQLDTDRDGKGDACEADDDMDGVVDTNDNCPLQANADQSNVDGDSTGDVCDPDSDGDGVLNAADVCPLVSDANQVDLDGDGLGAACDADDDGDSVTDTSDNCPLVANPDQEDFEGNGLGDACDLMIPPEQQEVPPEPDAQPVDETGGKPGCSTSGSGALLLMALALVRRRRATL
jgi:uncharacterized protein YraI